MIPGFATSAGTARYRDRFPALRDAGHLRGPQCVPVVEDLWLSSLGLGTYLGDPDDAGDARYTEAIVTALRSGINVLDTAINYRHQRSERNIGAALEKVISAGEIQRDEVLVCTKAGFLSFDGAMPPDARGYFMREYIQKGILDPKDLAGGMHCMSPSYLADQIERCRRNLRLETIDVFYVHNPEAQLGSVPPEEFRNRLKAAFSMLERAVEDGRIRYYGTATWNGYRVPQDEREYLSLAAIVGLAREAGGDDHHFRFVQLPFNLAMTEAFGAPNQQVNGKHMPMLAAAHALGVAVVGSATLYQGQLAGTLPAYIRERIGMASDAENAIQFARSAPGMTSSLIGMGRKEHVEANIKVAACPLAALEDWESLFDQEA